MKRPSDAIDVIRRIAAASSRSRVEFGMREELALSAYGYEPHQVVGGDEVWSDERGVLHTREAALAAIRYTKAIGLGLEYPEEWYGPLEGGEADTPKP